MMKGKKNKATHPTEMYLSAILGMIARANITTTAVLSVHPMLHTEFQNALRQWLDEVVLRSNKNVGIIRRLGLTCKDVAGDIALKIMRPERRKAKRDGKTDNECLNESLHPQLDLALACNTAKDSRPAIRYLVTIAGSYCISLVRNVEPETIATDVETLRHSDATACDSGAVRKHATPTVANDMQQKEDIIAAVSLFSGEDFLHDLAILSMKMFNFSCATLVKIILSGNAYGLSNAMAERISTMLSADCKGPDALGPFLAAARSYELPEKYRRDPSALSRRLYRATSKESMQELKTRMLQAIA